MIVECFSEFSFKKICLFKILINNCLYYKNLHHFNFILLKFLNETNSEYADEEKNCEFWYIIILKIYPNLQIKYTNQKCFYN